VVKKLLKKCTLIDNHKFLCFSKRYERKIPKAKSPAITNISLCKRAKMSELNIIDNGIENLCFKPAYIIPLKISSSLKGATIQLRKNIINIR
jgi:hypothetical protein